MNESTTRVWVDESMSLRAVQVIAGVANPAAGTTYGVLRLCDALAKCSVDVELHTLNPLPAAAARCFAVRGYDAWARPGKLGISFSMRGSVRAAADTGDLVHNHGLWLMPNVYASAAAARSHRPIVLSPHGMLAPSGLSRSRWKKAIFNRAGHRRVLEGATCYHATSAGEYADIRRCGLIKPVCIVPFGIDIPSQRVSRRADRRTVLFLGRLHPIKRIDVLLAAWRAVEDRFIDWDLIICGPDEDGYLSKLQRLAGELGTTRVRFSGPRFGEEKDRLLDECDLFVLPSFTENFGFVVAEAFAHGLPGIVTTTAPWAGIEQHRCGWWTNISKETLAAQLQEALALDASALAAMGERGRQWMIRDFSWDRVGEMMRTTYEWLLGRHEIPGWVKID